MSGFEARAERLAALAAEKGLDLVVISDLVNVRYLCGFTGTNGVCVVGADIRVFITDFRYVERASREVAGYEVVQGKRDLLGDVAELVKRIAGDRALRLGFEEQSLTVAKHSSLAALLPEPVELVPSGPLVQRLRAVKDERELEAIRSAAAMADDLYRRLIADGLAGRTELAVARALERGAQDMGAEAVAFPPIVAAAANGALPHAAPRDVEIPERTLVVVDLGCRVDGYCSDCTRTFATGEVGSEEREVYELVRAAQAAAVEAVSAGAEAAAVDAAARQPIEAAGRGDQFGHGTGHGVGLDVHEEPRVAPGAEGSLEPGNVVTVEPGVYVPGRFGVRIEDLVVVREGGRDVLTSVPRDLTIL